MRFWKRETKLETLEKELKKQIDSIDEQISGLKAELTELKGAPLDPVLHMFLRDRLQFDYEHAKRKWEWNVHETTSQLARLEKQRQKLEVELRKVWEKQRMKAMQLRFEGQGVLDSDGSTCRIKCANCGNVYTHDFKPYGAFDNILACTSQNELQFLYNRGVNIFEIRCPKCNASVVVKVFRGHI
jgi:hypothetical protein